MLLAYDTNLEEKNFEFNGSIVAFIDIMRPKVIKFVTDQLDELGPIKFYILFNVTYSRIDDNDDNGKTEKIVTHYTKALTCVNVDEIGKNTDLGFEQRLDRNDRYVGMGSGWTLDSIDRILIEIGKYNPLKGSNYIPTPKEVPA